MMHTVPVEAIPARPTFTRPDSTVAIPVPKPKPRSRIDPPRVYYDVRDKCWHLLEDYRLPDGRCTITIPAGFSFDLSSVPRVLWWILASFELGIAAPLVHDFLYCHGGRVRSYTRPSREYSRVGADRLFRRVMELEGVAKTNRLIAYKAVRWFGGNSWHEGAR